MKIYNFEQYSPEWWEIRAKKMTASHAQAIGSNGAGLKTYIREIMRPFFMVVEKPQYSNKTMERGLELEPSADTAYTFDTGIHTEQVGFVVHSDYVGCSPDRLADTNGLTEIKCLEDKAYFDLLLDGKIESKYIWQMNMQMLICQKEWCDFVAYNPNFTQYLWIERQYPDPKKISKLKEGFQAGEQMIKEIETKILIAA
jgi:exodeoxyribonuclease (lambda-induced)